MKGKYIKIRIGIAFVLMVILGYILGNIRGRMSAEALAAAEHAVELSEALETVNPVLSYTTYHSLSLDLDSAVVDADTLRGWLLFPSERKELDEMLLKVAEYRHEHPRWSPTPIELAKAEDKAKGKKSDVYIDVTPTTGPVGKVLSSLDDFRKQLAEDADKALARFEKEISKNGSEKNSDSKLSQEDYKKKLKEAQDLLEECQKELKEIIEETPMDENQRKELLKGLEEKEETTHNR